MSKADSSNYKSKKKYFLKKGANRRTLDVNLKGFLCSCNSREKDCIKESYNLLNEYADKLYPAVLNPSDNETDEQDISESLSKEISGLKGTGPSSERRFQVIESGAKNFLFIRTSLENPAELAEAIIKDIHDSGSQKTRFLLRLIPVEITCRATPDEIGKAFLKISEKHFKDSPQTFCVIFNHRNNNVVSRDEIIKLIADKVNETRSDHKVNLKGAKLSIIVEVIKGFAFLSVVPDYLKYKKYNLLSVCSQEVSSDK
ncbi:THUMP domain-containing protein 1 homolog [Tenebrio molitor]|jgi:tRNA acetyltransferase TAN1|uniref:THUMP domain-containing protein 1 homolog n=1 Tax=Tenebrio molitor TaxID=7067 RepID=UPI001C3BC70F|nr:unnamed protein product [Tenebrio molitor]